MRNKSLIFIDQPTDLLIPCQQPNQTLFCVFSHVLGFGSAYIFPIFAVFGLVTNILTFLTFVVWIAKPTRQMIYLACLALADIFNVIVFGWLWMFPAKGLPYASNGKVYFFTFNHGEIGCKIHRYFSLFASCLSCSLLTLAVADRTISVYFPLKSVQFGRQRAWIFVFIVFLLSAILMLPFATETGYYQDGKFTVCSVRYASILWRSVSLLLANCGLFQTLSVIILNVLLIVRLKQARTARKGLQASGPVLKTKEISASVVLLILSSIFLVCSSAQIVGYSMAFLLQYADKEDTTLLRYAWNISDTGWQLFFLQESINWVVYMMRMRNFRAVLMSKLCCRSLQSDVVISKDNCITQESSLIYELNFRSREILLGFRKRADS